MRRYTKVLVVLILINRVKINENAVMRACKEWNLQGISEKFPFYWKYIQLQRTLKLELYKKTLTYLYECVCYYFE